MGRREQALAAEGGERRGRQNAGGTGLHERRMEVMPQQQAAPIVVRVVEQPVKSTTVGDVVVGAIGLTGVLLTIALVSGALLGGALIGLKKMRAKNRDPRDD